MIDTELKDKVVLVTGGNNPLGIGAATARAFAAEGAKVFINYLRLSPKGYGVSEEEIRRAITPGLPLYFAKSATTADEVVQGIRDSGGQAEAWEADLADPKTITELFDRAGKAFGPMDVLINNAAHWKPDTLLPSRQEEPGAFSSSGCCTFTITPESHDQHFAVNSRAVALMMAEYARRHVERDAEWGRIINVSTEGASGFAGDVSYGASKHALESYSQAAAKELGKYGITVNTVSLGAIQTGAFTREMEKGIAAQYPLGRIGQPEDVADVIVFLASEQARWITGQLIYVGGGSTMHL